MKTKYQSEALQVIHEDMKSMNQLGIINEDRMKEFDKMCLVQEPGKVYEAKDLIEIEHNTVTQNA
jgi:DNA-binding transcriptional regulator YiaG